MPRWVLVLIGFIAIGAFLLLLFWPSGERRTPFNQPPEGSATYEGVDWDRYQGNASEGAALAQELCSRCHAVGPSGDSPVGDAPPFRQFAQMWPLEYLEEALGEGIMVGHREHEMPVFQFDVKEIADLTAYLEELGESHEE
jgi:mono/diheme cytochrome c family protein